MTDKELFEKIEKNFNLKKTKYLNEKFNNGNFLKTFNEVLEPTASNLGIKDTLSSLFGSGKVKRDALRRQQAQRLGKGFDNDKENGDKKGGEAIKFQQFLKQPGNESYRTVYNKVKKSGKIASDALTSSELEIYNKIGNAFNSFKNKTATTKTATTKDQQTADLKNTIDKLSSEFEGLVPMLSKFKLTNDFARTIIASKVKGRVNRGKSNHYENPDKLYKALSDVIITYLLETDKEMFQNDSEFKKRQLKLDTLVNTGIPKKYRVAILKELRSRIEQQEGLDLGGDRRHLSPEEIGQQTQSEIDKQPETKYNSQNLDDNQ
jgi:hypothetical protein